MKLKILGNSGGALKNSYSMSSLINNHILFDCGTGLLNISNETLPNITDVILSHCHLDHTAMLPFLLDFKVGNSTNASVTVHCLEETAETLRAYMFNDLVWPDFEKIYVYDTPILKFNIIKPFETFNIKAATFTPLPVIHQVPTIGLCLHGEHENFVFIADIIDAEPETWDYINNLDNLKQMVMEVSFPNSLEAIAKASYHLTPRSFKELLDTNLPKDIRLYYCHIKPRYMDNIIEEMRFLGEHISPLEIDQTIVL